MLGAWTRGLYFHFRSKIWPHRRVPRPRFSLRRGNFGDSAINEWMKVPWFKVNSKGRSRLSLTHLPVKPLNRVKTWDGPIVRVVSPVVENKRYIAYFSLRMHETTVFPLPIYNLTSPSCCSSTPISFRTRKFRRFA